MALPLSTEEDGEEEFIHVSNAAGYSQIPADHLSDSSDSSDGLSEELAQATSLNTRGRFNEGRSCLPDDEFVAHGHGTESRARNRNGNDRDGAPRSNDASYANGSCINVRSGMQNGVVNFSNGGDEVDINQVQNHGINSSNSLPDQYDLHIEGMEIHVCGQLSGLQLSAIPLCTKPGNEDEGENEHDVDDVDENDRQREEDAAMLRAQEEEEASRSAPLPPERCQAIRNAMRNVSLGGYRPEWADKIPEEQWLNKLRRK